MEKKDIPWSSVVPFQVTFKVFKAVKELRVSIGKEPQLQI